MLHAEPIPEDPDLPEVRILLTSEAGPALEAVTGGPVSDVRITQISYRPGRELVVTYRVSVPDGSRVPVVLSAGRIPDGAAVLERDGRRIGAWIFPHDPALPGLPVLFGPDRLAELLAPYGMPAGATVRTRSYRPRKRAVVEVTAPGFRLFVKSVRPSEVGRLQAVHTALAPRVRIPRSLGWSPEAGLVVLEAIPGAPLSSRPDPLPDPREIFRLLDALPPSETRVTPRRRRVGSHLRLLRAIAPHREPDLARLEAAAGLIPTAPEVPVHGDFHSGQVMVARGRITGLVDVDTAGMGERADDVANLLAHVHVTALGDPSGATGGFGMRLHAVAAGVLDDTDLRRRVAATIAGYAPGPWSRQETGWRTRVDARIEAALSWLPDGSGG